MKLLTSSLAIFVFCVIALSPEPAHGNPPHPPDLVSFGDLWEVTAWDDASPVHTQWATQGICFVPTGFNGTHETYDWFSTTFFDWNGRAVKEGDLVMLYGDYADDVGHDAMYIEIATPDLGSGQWIEWREDGGFGRTIGFANVTMRRVGQCSSVPPPIPTQEENPMLDRFPTASSIREERRDLTTQLLSGLALDPATTALCDTCSKLQMVDLALVHQGPRVLDAKPDVDWARRSPHGPPLCRYITRGRV